MIGTAITIIIQDKFLGGIITARAREDIQEIYATQNDNDVGARGP